MSSAGCPDLDVCRQAVSQLGNLTVEAWSPSSPSISVMSRITINFDTAAIPSAAEVHVGLELLALQNALLAPSSFVNRTVAYIFGSDLGQCPAGRVIYLRPDNGRLDRFYYA